MFKKLYNTIIITLVLLLTIPASYGQTDFCQKAIKIAKAKNQDIIAVIDYTTQQRGLYSITAYHSRDCHVYINDGTHEDPEVIASQTGFCNVLPASEINRPNLKCLKYKLCISEGECKKIVIKLTWNQRLERYTDAYPIVTKVDFQK